LNQQRLLLQAGVVSVDQLDHLADCAYFGPAQLSKHGLAVGLLEQFRVRESLEASFQVGRPSNRNASVRREQALGPSLLDQWHPARTGETLTLCQTHLVKNVTSGGDALNAARAALQSSAGLVLADAASLPA
jgi:hypothetical protein